MNTAAIASKISALFDHALESFTVGPFTVALGSHRGEPRVRVCGENGSADGVGSHTVCGEGEDYEAAARWLQNRAAAAAAASV